MQLFYVLHFYLVLIHHLDPISLLTEFYKGSQFLQSFFQILIDRFLPYKGILVGACFDLCTVYENGFSGQFSQLIQELEHFCYDRLCAETEMQGVNSNTAPIFVSIRIRSA